MSEKDRILGFDVGTTAVKGAVFDLDGEQLFCEREPCPNTYPQAGWVEQDPRNWLKCIFNIAGNTEINPDRLGAIGICSQVNTHVFVDAKGNALRNAIIWQDVRCADVVAELQERANQRGLDIVLHSSSLLSRAAWVAKNEPDVWDETRWILSPKDYCIMQLTGKAMSDPLSSFELVDVNGEYDEKILALFEGVVDRLAPLQAVSTVNGNCQHPELAASCPVVVGTMDAWGSVYGSGVVKSGDSFLVSGTSEILGMLSEQNNPAPGIPTFPPNNGTFLHAGPTQAGGDALSWFAEGMTSTPEEVIAGAEKRAVRDEPLIFLPYLMGERAPLWDANARATFCGLSKRHTQDDMALAVLEGVGFSIRHLLEEAERASGFRAESLRFSGGAAKSDFWTQIKANILERKLERVRNIDTGVFGVALMAMVGIGVYSDLDAATQKAVRIERVFEPQNVELFRCQELYSIYRDTYEALKPVFSRLSNFPSVSPE